MKKIVDVFVIADNPFRQRSQQGSKITKTTAAKGRTYYTTEDGRRYLIDDCDDANGNPRHREYSEYSAEYTLYETEEHARQYLEREELLAAIRNMRTDRMSLDTLRAIVGAINDQSAE